MNLRDLLKSEADRRGSWSRDLPLVPDRVFYLVRDMPYQRASSRDPDVIIREWRGTCSGKHYLLKAVYEQLGFESRLLVCTHNIDPPERLDLLPANLKTAFAAGPIPDVHNYLQIRTDAGWMDIDATWPLRLKCWGFAANETFVLGQNMRVACTPIETHVVPQDADPDQFKAQLIAQHCRGSEARRDAFIIELGRWLAVQEASSGGERDLPV